MQSGHGAYGVVTPQHPAWGAARTAPAALQARRFGKWRDRRSRIEKDVRRTDRRVSHAPALAPAPSCWHPGRGGEGGGGKTVRGLAGCCIACPPLSPPSGSGVVAATMLSDEASRSCPSAQSLSNCATPHRSTWWQPPPCCQGEGGGGLLQPDVQQNGMGVGCACPPHLPCPPCSGVTQPPSHWIGRRVLPPAALRAGTSLTSPCDGACHPAAHRQGRGAGVGSGVARWGAPARHLI